MPAAPGALLPPDRAHGDKALVLCAYLGACVSLALAGIFPINNPDAFGHLAQGRQIEQLGQVPLRDTFSFWQAQPAAWHNYEWLSDWLTYRVYALGGPNALIATKCLLLALAGLLIVRLAHLLGGARAAALCALLVVLAIPAARFRFTERPHLVTLPLIAAYLIGLCYLSRAFGRASARADALWIAGIALLHLSWVNLHGSHLLGLLVVLVFFVLSLREPDTRRRLAILVACLLVVSCISPFGPAILFDAVAHVVDPAYRVLVTEWQAWQPSDPLWLMLAPIVQTLALVFALRGLVRAGVAQRALLACACLFALAAFRSIRFVAEYLLLSAPILAAGFQPRLAGLGTRAFGVAAGAGAALAALLVPWGASRMPPYTGFALGVSTMGLPAASGQWLHDHAAHPRVLAAIEDSWYLMFALPDARFLIDGRVPFYGPEHIARVRQAFADPELLRALLLRYRVDVVVPRHTFKPHQVMMEVMRAQPDWSLVSIEDRYSVFVRNDLRLRAGSALHALPLEPNYELAWLVQADAAREREITAALNALPEHENTRGYRGWVRAILAIKPFLRGGAGNGLSPPASAAEVATLKQARAWLARAAEGAEAVPVVHAYHALACTALCELADAERAFARAREEGESRETLLGAEEIALRRGQVDDVAQFLERAASMPGASDDVWLAALRAGLRAPPRCP